MTITRALVFRILPAVALAAASLAAAAPSLTGTWVPDPAASTQGRELMQSVSPGAPPALPAVRIRHAEPRVTIENLDDDGSVISTIELTTDGTENVNPLTGGALTHRSSTVWDGAVLRTTWKLEQNGQVVITGTDARELTSPDALVVTTTTEDSGSRSRSVLTYRRKQS